MARKPSRNDTQMARRSIAGGRWRSGPWRSSKNFLNRRALPDLDDIPYDGEQRGNGRQRLGDDANDD